MPLAAGWRPRAGCALQVPQVMQRAAVPLLCAGRRHPELLGSVAAALLSLLPRELRLRVVVRQLVVMVRRLLEVVVVVVAGDAADLVEVVATAVALLVVGMVERMRVVVRRRGVGFWLGAEREGGVVAVVGRGRWRRGQRLWRGRRLVVGAREVVVGSEVLDWVGVVLVVIPGARGGSGEVVGVLVYEVVAGVRAAVVRMVEGLVRIHADRRPARRSAGGEEGFARLPRSRRIAAAIGRRRGGRGALALSSRVGGVGGQRGGGNRVRVGGQRGGGGGCCFACLAQPARAA